MEELWLDDIPPSPARDITSTLFYFFLHTNRNSCLPWRPCKTVAVQSRVVFTRHLDSYPHKNKPNPGNFSQLSSCIWMELWWSFSFALGETFNIHIYISYLHLYLHTIFLFKCSTYMWCIYLHFTFTFRLFYIYVKMWEDMWHFYNGHPKGCSVSYCWCCLSAFFRNAVGFKAQQCHWNKLTKRNFMLKWNSFATVFVSWSYYFLLCVNIKPCRSTDPGKGHKILFMTKLANQTLPTRYLGECDITSCLLCVIFSTYIYIYNLHIVSHEADQWKPWK